MIFPLLPLFLTKELGAGAAFLGVIEGAANLTVCLVSLVSGVWADSAADRSRFLMAGYGLAGGARSLIAAAPNPLTVLAIRLADRVGKGVRGAPRDAIIADAADPALRGRAFGFHRAMDNAGSVGGPLIASAMLACGVTRLQTVFAWAALPAIAAVALVIWKVREPGGRRPPSAGVVLEAPPPSLRGYLGVVFLFGLSQSTDAFLLLRAAELGVAAAALPLLWSIFHIVKIFAGLRFSGLSDRLGRRPVIVAGWIVYALSYAGFALASRPAHVWGLFCFYGLFYGLTEGPERALLADLAGPGGKAAAFGWFHFTSGVALLLASVVFGLVWQGAGPKAAFAMGSLIAAAASGLFLLIDLPSRA